ncbi:uncharacterized protein LOC136041839 [Artemia franciscana]|uniref:Uncharacterized protein n=1 Tax=Artemia franciscana TaxID=6661 RepID=A0AA88H7C3_ARTSF|nr:hypothetical protein QYM36_018104 [Artemia franciscana]KAK2703431.1 hypothetical protein QYM36_018104 [Artemia franciscana]
MSVRDPSLRPSGKASLAFNDNLGQEFFYDLASHMKFSDSRIISLANSSSANYTVNLTGVVLLGLAVSAAATFWAFLTVHLNKNKNDREYDGGYDDGYRKKRSLPESLLENIIFTIMELENKVKESRSDVVKEYEIGGDCCLERLVCVASSKHAKLNPVTYGSHLNSSFRDFQLYLEENSLKGLTRFRLNKLYGSWLRGQNKKNCDSDSKCRCSTHDKELLSTLGESLISQNSTFFM